MEPKNKFGTRCRCITFLGNKYCEFQCPVHGWVVQRGIIGKEETEEKKGYFNSILDIPNLTGLWKYQGKGKDTKWCASYLYYRPEWGDTIIEDTEKFDTPWEALEAVRRER